MDGPHKAGHDKRVLGRGRRLTNKTRRSFQRSPVPMCQRRRRLVCALEKAQQGPIGIFAHLNDIVGQQEFPQRIIKISFSRLHPRAGKTRWRRIGVAVEAGRFAGAVAGPESRARDLMAIGLADHGIGQMRHATGMLWRGAARKAGDRKIKASPEKVDRAAFAGKAAAKDLKYALRLQQGAPKGAGRSSVIGPRRLIIVKSDWISYLAGDWIHFYRKAKIIQCLHGRRIKASHALRYQRNLCIAAPGIAQEKTVRNKVKFDLDRATGNAHRASGEAADGDVKRNVPAVIYPGRQHQAHLAYHLGPKVQSVRRGADVEARQAGPDIFTGVQSAVSIGET